MASKTIDVYKSLRENLKLKVPLTDIECDEVLAAFKVKRVKKRQFIIQPEFVAKYRNYVVKGAFRTFIIDKDGIDRTLHLAIEDWWITDYNSYIFQTPATMFVEAMEDGIVLQIDYESEQQLKKANHKFETLFRIMAENSAAYGMRRLACSLTQSAEERYTELLQKYPLLVQRFPQYVLASFLDMTTGFLSRIRNNKVKR
jgi:CRP-like cAMP-binding protein